MARVAVTTATIPPRTLRGALGGGLLAAALVAVAALHLLSLLGTPSDGARATPGASAMTAQGMRIAPLDEGPLRSGDVVVAVDGVPIEDLARGVFTRRGAVPSWRIGDTVRYDVLRDGDRIAVAVTLGRYPLATVVSRNWGTIVFALVHASVALLLILRRPNVSAVRVLALGAAALLAATTWSFGLTVADLVNRWGFWLYHAGAMIGYMLFWTTGAHFAASFPRRSAAARSPRVVAAAYLAPFALLALYLAWTRASTASTLAWLETWPPTVGVHASIVLTLTLATFAWQYATVRSAAERDQIRLVVLGALVAGVAGLALYLVPPLLGANAVHSNVIGVVVVVFPIAIAIAVLRHALFDIDRLVGTTIVYGSLTLAVLAVYVAVVGVLGAMLRPDDDLLLGLLATGVVAVGFQPLRERLQRAVDRRMFGDRDDPVRMLERLGSRLEATADVDRLLPTLVETVAVALRLPYVALRVADGPEPVASYGRPQDDVLELPLLDGDEIIGWLSAAPRERGSELDARDRRVLEAVARQAGGAVRRVELTRDLERSRAQVVRLREEERRRLRRDLHDGLGPSLAALALKVDAARNLLQRDPGRTAELLGTLGADVQRAVAEVRRVAEGLRPPALDDLGLVGAIRERCRALATPGTTIHLAAPDDLGPLPAAVEVAAYFIVLEALTNVLRHARARHCRIAIELDRSLRIEVVDDGTGLGSRTRTGVGMHSMRERATEVGGSCTVTRAPAGGTRVVALLPLTGGAS